MTLPLRVSTLGGLAAAGPGAAMGEGSPVSEEQSLVYREGMSRLAAAVNIVATDGPAGRAGFTATAVASISDRPPTLLVCLNRASGSAARLIANGVFCVNTLAAEHRALAEDFAGRTGLHGEARFERGQWGVFETGAPLLLDALTSFDCRLVEVKDVATHHVLIGEVTAVRLGGAEPSLVYVHRRYHDV